jgi:hypothetical protein
MRLADRIAQCRTPFIVRNTKDGTVTHLSGAATFAKEILACPTRYVLSDDLTRLCTALAYSKGTKTLACADLLHVPAERVWVEWCEAPCLAELTRYGFNINDRFVVTGRRGALIHSSSTGRRGLIRAFWATGETELDVLASSMEAYFDFDTPDGEAPPAPDALLATRPGLSRRPLMLERLNRARSRSGKAPLLDHMEVFAPLIPEYRPSSSITSGIGRRPPRLHHVRGHLVRHGSQLFWRVPHLRGSARAGVVRTRTVTWTMDPSIGDSHHASADIAGESQVFIT